MNTKFKGVYAVAVTPFNEDGTFNYKAAKENLDWLIKNGVHGICVLGATGEYMSITNEEHKEYVKEIVPYICNRTSVIVGVTRERPDDVIELIQNAKNSGAHAAMVLPPYYCHPAQDEIFSHYKYIMEKVDCPLVIYNNPGSAGIEIEADTFDKILALKNSLIVKESSGDITKLTQVLFQAPENTSVFCGCDNMAYESLVTGAHGWISMLANVAPRDCVDLFNNIYEEGDFDKGKEIYKRLLPSLTFLENFPKPVQALKYGLNLKGLNGGSVRKPRLPLTEEEIESVVKTMNFHNIK